MKWSLRLKRTKSTDEQRSLKPEMRSMLLSLDDVYGQRAAGRTETRASDDTTSHKKRQT